MTWAQVGMAVANAIGPALETGNQYYTGKANAATTESIGVYQGKRIRQQGFSSASMARAIAAENGLDVDTGSAAMIQDQHIGDAYYNAYMTESQARYQSSLLRSQARTALVQGLIKTAGKAYEGYQMGGMGG